MEEKEKKKSLRDMKDSELKVLASDIRASILSVVLHNGGHLSSNLGIVDLTISLFRNFNLPQDDVLFDVGHQTYAYKILSGRSISHIRKTGGIAPFSLIPESSFDKYDSGHAGDCLSIAYGMAKAKNLKGDDSYTIAVLGDGSLNTGLTYEALNLLSTDKGLKNLIVIINDNGMAISQQVSALRRKSIKLRNSRFYFRTSSKLGSTMAKHRITWKVFLRMRNVKDEIKSVLIDPTIYEVLGLKYIGPFDGHDYDSLDLGFQKAKIISPKTPVVMHVFTHKGYGYEPAMKDEKGTFHGVQPNFDENTCPKESTFDALKEEYLLKKMGKDEKAFLITPAMILGSHLEKVFHQYPQRCMDVGIAEENAVSFAAGLALKGYHPIVDIYSSFMQRSFDEILEDVSRNEAKVLFLVDRAGLVGEDGATHQGLYDVSMLSSIPEVEVLMPFDEESFKRSLPSDTLSKTRFVRISKDLPYSGKPLQEEGAFYSFPSTGSKTLVFGVGPLGRKLLEELPDTIEKKMLFDLLPEEEEIQKLPLSKWDHIFLYDPYGIESGSACHLSYQLNKLGYQGTFHAFTFPVTFVTFGQREDLYRLYHLSLDQVKEELFKILEQNPLSRE